MDAEDGPVADVGRGMREHRVAGRVAGRLAHAFENDEHRGNRPAPGQGQERNGDHLDDVAGDGDRPELMGGVGEPPRHQAEAVAEQLAQTAHHRDHHRPGAQGSEVGTEDRPRPLVGEVGEEAQDADEEDESDGPRTPRRSHGPTLGRRLRWRAVSPHHVTSCSARPLLGAGPPPTHGSRDAG